MEYTALHFQRRNAAPPVAQGPSADTELFSWMLSVLTKSTTHTQPILQCFANTVHSMFIFHEYLHLHPYIHIYTHTHTKKYTFRMYHTQNLRLRNAFICLYSVKLNPHRNPAGLGVGGEECAIANCTLQVAVKLLETTFLFSRASAQVFSLSFPCLTALWHRNQ